MQYITAAIPFVSAEEHANLTATTPTSFADIPPVLLHREDNAEVTLEPGMAELPDSADGARVKGSLWITESQLYFLTADSRGFTIPYPQLTLHAISPASNDGPTHLYCQVEAGKPVAGMTAGAADDDDDEDQDMTELCVFVQDAASINTLFDALSKGASLHADPAGDAGQANFFNMSDGDEDEDGAFDDANEDEDGHDGGRSRVDFQTPDSRFRPY